MITLLQFLDSDDGYCEALRFSELCEQDTSRLVADVDASYRTGVKMASRCYWIDNKCYPNHPTDILSIMALAFVTSLIATPVCVAGEFVFNRVRV